MATQEQIPVRHTCSDVWQLSALHLVNYAGTVDPRQLCDEAPVENCNEHQNEAMLQATFVQVVKQALSSAGMSLGDLDSVELHGTGTALGDPIELGALSALFETSSGIYMLLLCSHTSS